MTIRLLDPAAPRKFLPQDRSRRFHDLAQTIGFITVSASARAEELHEFDPMLGHRGCRLGITYPEIYEMQARAIFEAACDVAAETEADVPEVMIPLVDDEARARDPQGRWSSKTAASGLRREGPHARVISSAR